MSNELQDNKQPIVTNAVTPALKNFFFYALKSKKEFKEAQKELGEITSVSIVITPARTFMRASSLTNEADTDFTPEEKAKMLKTFKVKKEVVDACKSIFIRLDMDKKNIHIQQNKLDGTQKNIII